MKTLKYLIAALAIAFALAGCAGGSGAASFDAADESMDGMSTLQYDSIPEGLE